MDGNPNESLITLDPGLLRFLDDAATAVAAVVRGPGAVPAKAFGPEGQPLAAMLATIEGLEREVGTALATALHELADAARHAQAVRAEADDATALAFHRVGGVA